MPELNTEKPVRRQPPAVATTPVEKAAAEKVDLAGSERAKLAEEAARTEDA